jgi:hypothetical protein
MQSEGQVAQSQKASSEPLWREAIRAILRPPHRLPKAGYATETARK